jgi:predicted ATP-grasp superfamily ATP-dependent carboligase
MTILVHEWVTGGGLSGRPLPPSWAAEGHAMRRAIARDFACLPGVHVVVTLDDRFADEPGDWSLVRVGLDPEETVFPRLSAEADYTVLIAPETDDILAQRARTIERVGGRSLGSTPAAIALAGDKLRCGQHLAELGIATPPSRRVFPGQGLPSDFPYPAVLKPIDGAGSQATYLIRDPAACPEEARGLSVGLLQPLVAGTAMSASFLVGRDGRARLIAAGQQYMKIHEDRFVYCGGMLPVLAQGVDDGPRRAAESIPGLCGFIGVDYLWDDVGRCATVVEVNPRPTTSYVGLAKWLSPGTLARAWLQVFSGMDDSNQHVALFANHVENRREVVSFTAEGGI